MIKDFLSKLGANTKITVGVSVSPGIGLEMIEVDRTTKMVNKYGCKPLEYNYSTREITDYAQFQMALSDLFDDLHIPKKSNIILNMPNIHFGIINLPLLLTDDAITNAIISEVEQSYIFKRQEPVVSWQEINSNVDTENRSLAYTAIQQTALDGITSACQEIGCTLIGVENSYASLLKALHFTDITKDQMKENITWNLMIVGQNSYSIFSLSGKKIIEYYEEPLALKSFVDDEIYNAITTSAQLTLAGLPANYLYVVSETDLVSAEVLSMKISFEGSVKFLECNKYTQNELLPVNLNILPNLALKISPESIGTAVYQFSNFPLKFNLTGEKDVASADMFEEGFPRINVGNMEVELTPDFIKKIALIIGGSIIIPALIIAIVLTKFVGGEQDKLNAIKTKIEQTKQEISKYSNANAAGAFDLNSTMSKIVTQNRTKLFYYSALGVSIPNKLWVTYYMTNESNGIDIKGKASDVESIYVFYKNLKQLVNNSDVKLYKLEMASDSIDDMIGDISSGPRYYNFEITNMTAEQLNPPKPGETPAASQPANAPKDDKKSGFQFGKPIFGPKENNPAQPNAGQLGAPAASQPPQPTQPTPPAPSSGGDKLPKNLEKIEKF